MRKFRYVAVAAASALVIAVPAGAAFAGTHASAKPVLTIGKGGKAIKNGATLTANLAGKSDVTFTIGKYEATCAKSSYTAKVVKNPATKTSATLSITKESLSGCKFLTALPLSTLSLHSLSALNLPANGTVTTKDGVTISETATSKPIGFLAAIYNSGAPFLSCYFTAAKVTGTASNKADTVAFKNQSFTLNKKLTSTTDQTYCAIAGTTSEFTATYGPVTTKGGKVYVN
jgi:hypothetical protein